MRQRAIDLENRRTGYLYGPMITWHNGETEAYSSYSNLKLSECCDEGRVSITDAGLEALSVNELCANRKE